MSSLSDGDEQQPADVSVEVLSDDQVVDFTAAVRKRGRPITRHDPRNALRRRQRAEQKAAGLPKQQ